LLALVPLALGPLLRADEPATAPTRLTERGKLLFADDLTHPLGHEWRAAKGRWEVVDGAIRGTEQKADMHAAVIRHALPFRDAVIQYSFKLDGARAISLSINKAKGHLCRVRIDANGFTVQKDKADKTAADKPVVFETRKVPVKPGVWHTLVVELSGKEMLACLDGEHVTFGAHDALDAAKANLGLTVAGESASYKD